MNQDKAIIKALKTLEGPILSDNFSSGMMNRIYLVEAKKKRRAYIGSLCLLSAVSLGMISMAVYLLRDYLSDKLTFQLPGPETLIESISRYGFGFYIAFLTIILIALDYYFRSAWQKHKNEKFGHTDL
jgi:hypothetical protein